MNKAHKEGTHIGTFSNSFKQLHPIMINRINNTTNKANPPAKPQPSPQLPPYPITIVPPLDKRVKLGSFHGF